MVLVWMTFSDIFMVMIIQRQITWKWYNIQLLLQWPTNTKSYMIYQTTPFSMILNDPCPSFKVTPFFDAEYLSETVRHTECHWKELSYSDTALGINVWQLSRCFHWLAVLSQPRALSSIKACVLNLRISLRQAVLWVGDRRTSCRNSNKYRCGQEFPNLSLVSVTTLQIGVYFKIY